MPVPISGLGELVHCSSFTATKDAGGYTIAEAEDRFRRERVAEGALRIAGVALIVAGIVQWFLPALAIGGGTVFERSVLTAAFIGTGVALYLFASRGFRRALKVDVARRQLGIARLNARNRWLVRREIPLTRIESLVVKRPTPDRPLAELRVRIKGVPGSVSVMRGASDEIETLHRRLCIDIRLTLQSGEVQPVRVKKKAMKSLPLFQTRRPRKEAA